MIIGFTGSSTKITIRQSCVLLSILTELNPSVLHHGDCIMGDKLAHMLVRKHFPTCHIVIHPPSDPSKRAYCQGDEMRQEKYYLDRDTDIARECEVLVAAPKEAKEVVRSGTWATVRRARRFFKPIIYVMFDGMIIREHPCQP